jgi:hypothetical protein
LSRGRDTKSVRLDGLRWLRRGRPRQLRCCGVVGCRPGKLTVVNFVRPLSQIVTNHWLWEDVVRHYGECLRDHLRAVTLLATEVQELSGLAERNGFSSWRTSWIRLPWLRGS